MCQVVSPVSSFDQYGELEAGSMCSVQPGLSWSTGGADGKAGGFASSSSSSSLEGAGAVTRAGP